MSLLLVFLIGQSTFSFGSPQSPAPAEATEGFRICGLSGTSDQRVNECADRFPKLSPQSFSNERTGERFRWWLFARTSDLKEVWYDSTNKMLWSDAVTPGRQQSVAATCASPKSALDAKGYWEFPWILPTRHDVLIARAMGLLRLHHVHSLQFRSIISFSENYFWTNDLAKVTSPYKGYPALPYYYYYSINQFRFSYGSVANPSHWDDEILSGLCIFRFRK